MGKKFLFWEPIVWYNNNWQDSTMTNISPIIFGVFVGYIVFFIGVVGLFFREASILYVMIAVELFLFGLNLVFLSLSIVLNEPQLQVMVLLILTVTAAETAIGLALVVLYHRVLDTTSLGILTQLKY